MFADVVQVKLEAGKGGNGALSFHRTKANAKGGPDGGDGGEGGSIVVRADHNTSTLSKYRTSKVWKAEAGTDGSSGKRRGKHGADVILVVPPGTVVHDGKKVVADLEKEGDESIVAFGGRGGFGNAHFISSVRRAPKISELGEDGDTKELTFELKLVADVGLVGLPNAGKSTLLSVVSNAKPKVADYPFTTLEPNLGVVDIDGSSFLAADIPGLIEGASEGKGLGDEFLRHIERTKLLLHLIDATVSDIGQDYTTIQQELKGYKIDLSKKPQIAVLTKIESVPKADIPKKIAEIAKAAKLEKSAIHTISAVAGIGLAELLRSAAAKLDAIKQFELQQLGEQVEELPVIKLDEAATWEVKSEGGKLVVYGKEIEGFAKRTNFDQYQSVQRLLNILERKGIARELIRHGAIPGQSKIYIAGKAIDF